MPASSIVRVARYTGIYRDIPVFHGTYLFVIGYTGMSQDIPVCPGTYGYIPGQTPVRRKKNPVKWSDTLN
jgi:hypothetical protein